jgi:hypothetical protein
LNHEWLVCVHEAGHAVLGALCGGQVVDVTVKPRAICYAKFGQQDWRNMVLFLMGGFWAQHHVGRYDYPWDYSALDKQQWQACLAKHHRLDETEDDLFRRAEALILQHRTLVYQVAKALSIGEGFDYIRPLIASTARNTRYEQHPPCPQRRH